MSNVCSPIIVTLLAIGAIE